MRRPEPREGPGQIDDAGEQISPDCDIRWVRAAPTSTQWLAWRRLWEKLLHEPPPEVRQHEGSHDKS
jgi:hypothetical protein